MSGQFIGDIATTLAAADHATFRERFYPLRASILGPRSLLPRLLPDDGDNINEDTNG